MCFRERNPPFELDGGFQSQVNGRPPLSHISPLAGAAYSVTLLWAGPIDHYGPLKEPGHARGPSGGRPFDGDVVDH